MTPLNNKAEDWLAQVQPESNMQKMHIAGADTRVNSKSSEYSAPVGLSFLKVTDNKYWQHENANLAGKFQ